MTTLDRVLEGSIVQRDDTVRNSWPGRSRLVALTATRQDAETDKPRPVSAKNCQGAISHLSTEYHVTKLSRDSLRSLCDYLAPFGASGVDCPHSRSVVNGV